MNSQSHTADSDLVRRHSPVKNPWTAEPMGSRTVSPFEPHSSYIASSHRFSAQAVLLSRRSLNVGQLVLHRALTAQNNSPRDGQPAHIRHQNRRHTAGMRVSAVIFAFGHCDSNLYNAWRRYSVCVFARARAAGDCRIHSIAQLTVHGRVSESPAVTVLGKVYLFIGT